MILFDGDPHGYFKNVLPSIQSETEGVAAVIFLGDIETQRRFEDEICFFSFRHEPPSRQRRLSRHNRRALPIN